MLSKFHKNSKGFTLVELMIVVVIIGILAALAIPRFMRATTKSKQSEAKGILKQIYVMEHAYRQDKDTYVAGSAIPGGSIADIGVEIMSTARYSYVIVASTTIFTATATSGILDDDATTDVWTINQAGCLLCTTDDAAG